MKYLLLFLLLSSMVVADSLETTIILGGSQESVLHESYSFQQKPLLSVGVVVGAAGRIGRLLSSGLDVATKLVVLKPFFKNFVNANVEIDAKGRVLSSNTVLEYWITSPSGEELDHFFATVPEQDQVVKLQYLLPLFAEEGEWNFFTLVTAPGLSPITGEDTFQVKDYRSLFVFLGIILIAITSFLLYTYWTREVQPDDEAELGVGEGSKNE